MENRYICEKCKFKCDTKARWDAHVNTELHKTGQRKKRSDYKVPFKCDYCEYETKNNVIIKIHKLNKHSNKEDREKEFTYYCKCCDYGSFSCDMYNKHISTIKHKYYIALI
jgi:hypothetical protein